MKTTNDVINFTYCNINTEAGLLEYSLLADSFNLRKGTHSKPKNYVMNSLYSTDLSSGEKEVFVFLYDQLSQQKYLPGVKINNTELARILNKDKSTIGNIIKKLIDKNLVIKVSDIYGYDNYVINENINNWGCAVDKGRMDLIELLRKQLASLNNYRSEKYHDYVKTQQAVEESLQ